MRRFWIYCWLCMWALGAGAQTDVTTFSRHFKAGECAGAFGAWTCIGPFGQPENQQKCVGCNPVHSGAGQIHQLRFSPQYLRDRTVYACSAWGGLWKSVDGGDHWAPTGTDTELPFTSVIDIAIDPVHTDILYIATGEGQRSVGHFSLKQDGSPSAFTPLFTAGVFRSLDGGRHWEPINGPNQALLSFFKNGGYIRQIQLHPQDPNQLWISGSEGVFRCANARSDQVHWEHLTPQIDDPELNGLVFYPGAPDTLWLSGKNVYRSQNGGRHWESIPGNGPLPAWSTPSDSFSVERIQIAACPAQPQNLYAYAVGTATDCSAGVACVYLWNGDNWQLKHRFCAKSAFDAVSRPRTALAVSPQNPNELYFGHTKVRGTTNIHQPASFQFISPYYESRQFHADVFALAFEPGAPFLWAATDGGIHKKDLRSTGLKGWTDQSDGLAVATVYRFGHSELYPDRIMMGTQDCGTFIHTAEGGWKNIYGGDGYNGKMDLTSGLAYGYSSAANGLLVYNFDQNKASIEPAKGSFPTDLQPGQGTAWIRSTFDLLNHPAHERAFFTFSELYERKKTAYQPGQHPDSLWLLRSDIGKTTPAQWQRQLQILDIAASQPDYILAAQNGGVWDHDKGGFSVAPRLFLSVTGGCDGKTGYEQGPCFEDITPRLIQSGIHTRHYQPLYAPDTLAIPVITGVLFHPERAQKAWITFSGYEPGAKIWTTDDGGRHWYNADPTGSLHNVPVNDLVFQRGSRARVYLGTDAGIWYKDERDSVWLRYCDFPQVRVTELQIHYGLGKLRAATFGRSIWEGDLLPAEGLGATALTISKGEQVIWTQSRALDRHLRIKKGGELHIKGPDANRPILIGMPKNGAVIIEKGGRLILENAVMGNHCGQPWKGIQAKNFKKAVVVMSGEVRGGG